MEKSKIKQKKLDQNQKEKKTKLERLYSKKPLIEFIVAVLSIPSILLILVLNYNSIKNLDGSKPTPTPVQNPTTSSSVKLPNFFTEPVKRGVQPTASQPSSSPALCNKSLGPVNITSPNEGDVVNTNPVEVDISYDDSDYCSAVWSYSVNGSNWSPYDNNSVALYNLPNGPVTFELQVKSLTSSDQTTLTRHFTYNGESSIMATPTNASGSAQ
jgi:hypothetical protein